MDKERNCYFILLIHDGEYFEDSMSPWMWAPEDVVKGCCEQQRAVVMSSLIFLNPNVLDTNSRISLEILRDSRVSTQRKQQRQNKQALNK